MEKVKKSSRIYIKVIYALFFVTVYIYSIYILLPYGKIKDYSEVKIGEATSCNVKIANMTFGIFSGAKLTGVKVEKNIKGTAANVVSINELNIMPDYFSLLSDVVKLNMVSKMYGGELQGAASFIKKGFSLSDVDFALKDIDISKIPLLNSLYNIDAYGSLKGSVALNDIQDGITRSTGMVDISINNCGFKGIVINNVGSGLFKINNMKLPDVAFNDIKISLEKEQKILRVKDFKLEGDDLNCFITGNVNLNNNIKASSGALDLKLNVSQDYIKKDETLTLLHGNIGSLKDKDGFFNIRVEGVISNPKIRNL